MAHRTQLNTQIAELTGISKHTIDRIGVNLNKGGLISTGGRGRHAPNLGPEDLKNIILALLGAEKTSKVFQVVLGLHVLKSKTGELFGDVLLDICSNHEKSNEVMQLTVLRNYPQATIYWKDESGSRVGRMQNFRGGSEEQPGLRVFASLHGSVITELVKILVEPDTLLQKRQSDHDQ
jgi:hypothetical protein